MLPDVVSIYAETDTYPNFICRQICNISPEIMTCLHVIQTLCDPSRRARLRSHFSSSPLRIRPVRVHPGKLASISKMCICFIFSRPIRVSQPHHNLVMHVCMSLVSSTLTTNRRSVLPTSRRSDSMCCPIRFVLLIYYH